MISGRDWIASLPDELATHREALARLLAHCESTPEITSFSVGCSLGRGVADELSDIDAAIGVLSTPGDTGTETVRSVEQGIIDLLPEIGPLLDLLRQGLRREEFSVRTVFAQYADRLQLDLAVVPEGEIRRGDAAPDFIELHRSGPEHDGRHPSALAASEAQLREWTFLGWRALLDADKYLRRGSVWEAHQRLHETRDHIWKLWAAGHGALYPWHGLSQVLDHAPEQLPDRIEDTVAGLDPDGLRRAVLAAADALDEASKAAANRTGIVVRLPIGRYARGCLAAGT
jgi:hypothetical protein